MVHVACETKHIEQQGDRRPHPGGIYGFMHGNSLDMSIAYLPEHSTGYHEDMRIAIARLDAQWEDEAAIEIVQQEHGRRELACPCHRRPCPQLIEQAQRANDLLADPASASRQRETRLDAEAAKGSWHIVRDEPTEAEALQHKSIPGIHVLRSPLQLRRY
jgi:hypothetical protein